MPATDPPPLFDAPVSPLDHGQAMSYLPWLAHGDLEPDIRRRLLAHLDQCADCRRELLYISELRAALDVTAIETSSASATPPLDIESSLASVMQRIDRAQPPADAARPVPLDSRRRPVPSRRFGLAMAAGLVLAVLAGFMLRPLLVDPVPGISLEDSEPVPGTYTTLSEIPGESQTATAGKHGAELSIGFQPDTSITRIQAILQSIDGQIVGGPSALGILTVALKPPTESDALERALTTLRAQPETSFAEPAFPEARPSAMP